MLLHFSQNLVEFSKNVNREFSKCYSLPKTMSYIAAVQNFAFLNFIFIVFNSSFFNTEIFHLNEMPSITKHLILKKSRKPYSDISTFYFFRKSIYRQKFHSRVALVYRCWSRVKASRHLSNVVLYFSNLNVNSIMFVFRTLVVNFLSLIMFLTNYNCILVSHTRIRCQVLSLKRLHCIINRLPVALQANNIGSFNLGNRFKKGTAANFAFPDFLPG